MTEDEVFQALASRLPSDRMTAATWLAEHPPRASLRPALTAAASHEGVPRIRAVLQQALKVAAKPVGDSPKDARDPDSVPAAVLADLSSLIRHEMQPAVGWVRYAAHGEIPNFESSATNAAINGLRRRVAGLVQLADAHRLPNRESTSLVELLRWSVPKDEHEDLFVFEAPQGLDDSIDTDVGLFVLLVGAAMQNAADAVVIAGSPSNIFVTVGVTDKDFWVSIVNRHLGANWEFGDVAATGVSSKANKRGMGTRVMGLAADRLGYDLDLKASGGTVTFTVHGSRRG